VCAVDLSRRSLHLSLKPPGPSRARHGDLTRRLTVGRDPRGRSFVGRRRDPWGRSSVDRRCRRLPRRLETRTAASSCCQLAEDERRNLADSVTRYRKPEVHNVSKRRQKNWVAVAGSMQRWSLDMWFVRYVSRQTDTRSRRAAKSGRRWRASNSDVGRFPIIASMSIIAGSCYDDNTMTSRCSRSRTCCQDGLLTASEISHPRRFRPFSLVFCLSFVHSL